MQAIIACMIAVGISACNIDTTKPIESRGFDYMVVVIDGCQYIKVDKGIMNNRVFSLTHKGDCNNPIHKVK